MFADGYSRLINTFTLVRLFLLFSVVMYVVKHLVLSRIDKTSKFNLLTLIWLPSCFACSFWAQTLTALVALSVGNMRVL